MKRHEITKIKVKVTTMETGAGHQRPKLKVGGPNNTATMKH